MPVGLPIDASLGEIVSELRNSQNLVVQAAPGAGKTTRVPPALLPLAGGDVIVLEPRRIAARMAARRVAEEMGEKAGETVGYQVRFEEVTSPRTRLLFVTEGVMTRRLLTDPELRNVAIVVIDEFHERHLDGDAALALLRRLQRSSRPDLRIVVISATLDVGPLEQYLRCRTIRSEGRQYPVEVRYAGHSGAALEEQVADAVAGAEPDGDILVFLPGAAEIRRAARSCEGLARSAGLLLLSLHGDMSPEDQDRAVRPADRRKLILSTNVAESSITIEGVTTVIDSGLARIALDSPSTGLPTLQVRRISQASAVQRAGRAGRVRAGRAIRLYSEEDFRRRPVHDAPEIQRRDLSQLLLELQAMRIGDMEWFESPPAEAWNAAQELLNRLGAPEHAMELSRYPLHPRLARMILEASRRNVAGEAVRIAALLSAGDRPQSMDVLEAEIQPTPKAEAIERQIRRLIRTGRDTGSEADTAISILTAYPDRVVRRQTARSGQLCNGRPVQFASDWASPLLAAADIEERRESGPALVRLAAAVQPEWLLDLYPERIRERNEVTWNREAERVEAVSALLYDEIPIEETRGAPPDPELAARLLAEKALESGIGRFVDPQAMDQFLMRAAFAAGHSDLRPPGDEDIRAAVEELSAGLRSLSELERAAAGGRLITALENRLGPREVRTLNEVAPQTLPIGRRQARVFYARGQTPWVASRLQDFFGMKETPRIARGQVPLVVHLLAPNGRPVQMTSDLSGFWQKLYPQVRRELSRRYPKHHWPENPG